MYFMKKKKLFVNKSVWKNLLKSNVFLTGCDFQCRIITLSYSLGNQKKHHSILEKLRYRFLFSFLPTKHLNVTYKDYIAVYIF